MWHSFTWKLDETGCFVLLFLLAQKMKLADGFMGETGIKLWNRQNSVGKKIETDGTRLRRGRQFQFFPDRIWTVSQF